MEFVYLVYRDDGCGICDKLIAVFKSSEEATQFITKMYNDTEDKEVCFYKEEEKLFDSGFGYK